jgi:hypothetical protein
MSGISIVPEKISFSNMPFATRSTAAAGSTVAASTAAIVTPTIDEFEQASVYAACSGGGYDDVFRQPLPRVSSFHQEQCHDDEQWRPRYLTGLESMIDAALPCVSFYSTADDDKLNMYEDKSHGYYWNDVSESIASSVTVDVSDCNPQELDREVSTDCASDVMQAAGILCHFKNDAIIDCSAQGAIDIVEIAANMLADENPEKAINSASMKEWLSGNHLQDREVAIATAATSHVAAFDSLVHPVHLAIDDDADEVNKLHQYVRKELLEIFVVPQQTACSDYGDDIEEDNDEGDGYDEDGSCTKDTPTIVSIDGMSNTNRHLVTRHRSIDVSSLAPFTAAQRYYPGRVGLRCAHCANVRRKSTSKAAFYPLRLKNIYREVCAWQRIHFKKCPHVPDTVRERYDYYKRIDTSRGKVKYWESSARKIGLENNLDRYVLFCLRHFSPRNIFAHRVVVSDDVLLTRIQG